MVYIVLHIYLFLLFPLLPNTQPPESNMSPGRCFFELTGVHTDILRKLLNGPHVGDDVYYNFIKT